ncbi:MAG: efflux RND transporter periplasmic adaptor subunit [Candidatus Binatia bacterium]|jgi:HlyD family secretion protein
MSNASLSSGTDINTILGTAGTRARFGRRLRWIGIPLLILVGAAGYLSLRSGNHSQAPPYETETVARGNLVVTVSATGTLEPTNQVDVGSELSGLIEVVLAEENDRVTQGQVLARLDISKLTDEITKSQATLASAEAKVLQTTATTKEARANLARLRAVSRLSGGKVPSKAEMETAEATLARAAADVASARAAVSEAHAVLSSNQTNLSKASIRSPINGVVLSRKIEPGQTVAAAMTTPVLFTLAEDLSQMKLQVKVDEADVGQVEEGQFATFTVDAYPTRKFPARIRRVGFGSQTTDNVVTYKTILTVNNDDLSLRPGMTATAEITTAQRENVLLVPNAALRFMPTLDNETNHKSGGGIIGSLLPHPPEPQPKKLAASPAKSSGQRVWILRNGEPAAVDVIVGVTDGRFTEVVGGAGEALEAGMQVITDARVPSK